MSAIINVAIGKSNFETIRDSIATVLLIELQNQYTLDNTIPNIQQVFIERFVSINSETEVPCINISIDKGNYSNENLLKQDGEYIFNIDVYTASVYSDASGAGDVNAMYKMRRLLGLIRAILSYSGYYIAGNIFGSGVGFIDAYIERFFVADKTMVGDALSDVVGRIQLLVKCIETNPVSTGIGKTILDNTLKVKLNNSIYGFYINFDMGITDESGNPITNESGIPLTIENI